MKIQGNCQLFLVIFICIIGTTNGFGMLPIPESVSTFGQSILERIQGLAQSFFQVFSLRSSTSPRNTATRNEATTAAPVEQQATQGPIRQRAPRPQAQPQTQTRQQQQQQNFATFRPFQQQLPQPQAQQQQQQKGQQQPNNLLTFTTSSPNFNTNFQRSTNNSFGSVQGRQEDDDDVDLQYEIKRLNGLLK